MRKLINRLLGRDAALVELGHVPVQASFADLVIAQRKGGRSREEKLMAARQRYGRAFKCGATDQDREVMIVPGTYRIVRAGRYPGSPRPPERAAVDVEAPPVVRSLRRS